MERLCQGQTDALDELYARYAKRHRAFCDNMMRATDPGAAEDVAQDVFLRGSSFQHRDQSTGAFASA
jgi:DNA-directed RNA polymerase specialized sigma24 family protein